MILISVTYGWGRIAWCCFERDNPMKRDVPGYLLVILHLLAVSPLALGDIFLDFTAVDDNSVNLQTYGDVDGVVDVSYRQRWGFGNVNPDSLDPGVLSVWTGSHPNSYGNLLKPARGSSFVTDHVGEIKFESQSASWLKLNSFDVAAWFPNDTVSVRSFRVYDGNYTPIFELNNFAVTYSGYNTIFPNVSAHTLILQWDYPYNVALDNISVSPVPGPSSDIAGSFVYHKGSTFDAGGTNIPAALDAGKSLAQEGLSAQQLGFNNLINSTRGINGLVFDIDQLPGSLSASDFVFQWSPQGAFVEDDSNAVGQWANVPVSPTVNVTSGSPSRVIITWPDHSIVNRWLRVTVKANANTGLETPEVYYLGHLRGETTGASSGVFSVSYAQDLSSIRLSLGMNVNSGSTVDIDKNGLIQFADIVAMRSNAAQQLTQITIPAANP